MKTNLSPLVKRETPVLFETNKKFQGVAHYALVNSFSQLMVHVGNFPLISKCVGCLSSDVSLRQSDTAVCWEHPQPAKTSSFSTLRTFPPFSHKLQLLLSRLCYSHLRTVEGMIYFISSFKTNQKTHNTAACWSLTPLNKFSATKFTEKSPNRLELQILPDLLKKRQPIIFDK